MNTEEIEPLLKDKARLDWLEGRANQSFATEGDEEAEYVGLCEAWPGHSLRDAIDKQITKSNHDGREPETDMPVVIHNNELKGKHE